MNLATKAGVKLVSLVLLDRERFILVLSNLSLVVYGKELLSAVSGAVLRYQVLSRMYECRSLNLILQYLDGELKVDELITARVPLEDINKAFDWMHEGTAIRTMVDF